MQMIRSNRYHGVALLVAAAFGSSVTILLVVLFDNSKDSMFAISSKSEASWPPLNDSAFDEDPVLNISVLCFVLTTSQGKTLHVANTWAKRCSKILFVSSQPIEGVDVLVLPVAEGRPYLWDKTKKSLQHIYDKYFDEFDWFLKADDDTYVIMENLRLMLEPYNTAMPIYFGLPFRNPYMNLEMFVTGGSGYVLSKEALRRFVEVALPDKKKCEQLLVTSTGEDVEISKCLRSVGVDLIDTRDAQGRQKMFHFKPETILTNLSSLEEVWQTKQLPYHYYNQIRGEGCCSEYPVSFHYIEPMQMYLMEYLIYKVRAYGVEYQYSSQPGSVIHSYRLENDTGTVLSAFNSSNNLNLIGLKETTTEQTSSRSTFRKRKNHKHGLKSSNK